MRKLSSIAARRIALAAQGFGGRRQGLTRFPGLGRLLDRIHLFQIDSVNVLVRAHYLPAFSRLGPYDTRLVDQAAWGSRSRRRLFEYWGHEASLLPLDMHPLLRWRMARADRGELGWRSLRAFATTRRGEAEAVMERIRAEGPLGATDFAEGRSRPGWWEWGQTKQALEWLFWAGHITTLTRRGNFERVYDLSERVIPGEIMALPTPSAMEARRALVEKAAAALGIATAGELRDYFRLGLADTRVAIDQLEEAGSLVPVTVEGWRQRAWLHPEARTPRSIRGRALLAPFDPLVWERSRTERLFGFRYRIEIYTPAEKRIHGYYVLPFLLGDRLVARVDLKADRARQRLIVAAVHVEPGAPGETLQQLEEELQLIAEWLGLRCGTQGS